MNGGTTGNFPNPVYDEQTRSNMDILPLDPTPNTPSSSNTSTLHVPSVTTWDDLFRVPGSACPSKFAFSHYLSGPGRPRLPTMNGIPTYHPAFVLYGAHISNNKVEIQNMVAKYTTWNDQLPRPYQLLNLLFRDYTTKTLFYTGRPDWYAPIEAVTQFGEVGAVLEHWWTSDRPSEPFPERVYFGKWHAFIHLRAGLTIHCLETQEYQDSVNDGVRALQVVDFSLHYSHAAQSVVRCASAHLQQQLRSSMELTIRSPTSRWDFYRAVVDWDTFIMVERASCTPYTNGRNMKLAGTYINTFSNESTLTLNEVSAFVYYLISAAISY